MKCQYGSLCNRDAVSNSEKWGIYVVIDSLSQAGEVLHGCLPVLHQDLRGKFAPQRVQGIPVCRWDLRNRQHGTLICDAQHTKRSSLPDTSNADKSFFVLHLKHLHAYTVGPGLVFVTLLHSGVPFSFFIQDKLWFCKGVELDRRGQMDNEILFRLIK